MTKEKTHPWRLCPAGQYWVRTHPRHVQPSPKNPTGLTEVEGHCKTNPSRKDQIYLDEIGQIATDQFSRLKGSPKADDLDYPKGNDFDVLIRG
ncbi:MAG: hypothetical protein AB1540_04850 [Bdellovibrionota bacterium]